MASARRGGEALEEPAGQDSRPFEPLGWVGPCNPHALARNKSSYAAQPNPGPAQPSPAQPCCPPALFTKLRQMKSTPAAMAMSMSRQSCGSASNGVAGWERQLVILVVWRLSWETEGNSKAPRCTTAV